MAISLGRRLAAEERQRLQEGEARPEALHRGPKPLFLYGFYTLRLHVPI